MISNNRLSLNKSINDYTTVSGRKGHDKTFESLVKARSFLNDGKHNKLASRYLTKSVTINRKKL